VFIIIPKVFQEQGFESYRDIEKYVDHIKLNPKFLGKKLEIINKYAYEKSYYQSIKFLDIGCYIGLFLYHLDKENFFNELVGIDIEPEFIKIGKKVTESCQKVVLLNKNLFDLDIDNKYDMIFMGELIEHLDNPKRYLEKVYELLNPDGILIISTPSATGITNILLNLKNRDLKYIEDEVRGVGSETDHYYCWDKLTLLRLCHSVGFRYVSHYTTNPFNVFKGQSIIMVLRK